MRRLPPSLVSEKSFVEERTKNFDGLWKVVQEYTPEKAAEMSGVPAEDIRRAAEIYAKACAGQLPQTQKKGQDFYTQPGSRWVTLSLA